MNFVPRIGLSGTRRASRFVRALVLGACVLALHMGWSPNAVAGVKLTGIVQTDKTARALLEHPDPVTGVTTAPIMRAGESSGGVEVVRVDPDTGTVELMTQRGKQTLKLDDQEAPSQRMLHLHQAKLDQVLEIYQMVGNCTLVRPASLTSFRIDLHSEPSLSATQAMQVLDKVLTENGLFVEHRGKFTLIVPADRTNVLQAIPSPPAETVIPPSDPASQVFPPGLIRFQDADVAQALDFYAELSDKNLLRNPILPETKVTVTSQSRMNAAEAVWLMEAVLRTGGIVTIPAGKNFVFVMPADKPGLLPRYDEQSLSAKAGPGDERIQVKLANATTKSLLGFYAELTGREALPIAPGIPAMLFSFQGRKPLRKPEAIFALEALAALNGLRFELIGEKHVELVPTQ